MTSEPILVNAALGAIGLLTVATFAAVYRIDRKLNELVIVITHEDIGVLARLKLQEHRTKRHSDALRALGADLDE